MEKVSKEKHSRDNIINDGYFQINFLIQLGLIKNDRSDQLKEIAIHEFNKIKFELKECVIKLERMNKFGKIKMVKRKRKTKRDNNFVYF